MANQADGMFGEESLNNKKKEYIKRGEEHFAGDVVGGARIHFVVWQVRGSRLLLDYTHQCIYY